MYVYLLCQNQTRIKLEHGVTYDLIIYLKLSDGAEIIFWREEHEALSQNTHTGLLNLQSVNALPCIGVAAVVFARIAVIKWL